MDLKIKRMIAFVIDWNIMLLAPLLVSIASVIVMNNVSESFKTLFMLITIVAIFSAFFMVALKDIAFKGRSLGKRLFKMTVVDKTTRLSPTKRQLILRNAFFFMCPIDLMSLLLTGNTIGDGVANTEVIYEKDIGKEATNEYSAKNERKRTRNVLIGIVVIILLVIGIFPLIKLILNNQKDTPEYKVAYSYLVNSETFKEMGADEDDISFNSYSYNSTGKEENVTIGFSVNSKRFEVSCHKQNEEWVVCDECTLFD